MADGSNGVLDIVASPSFLGVAVLGVLAVYYFVRDARSPERTASASILSEVTGNATAVYDMAERAFKMATEANEGLGRCERRNAALVKYNLTLTSQLITHGIVPAVPPSELLE